MTLDDFGGRKFILSASTGFVASVLVAFSKITPDVYATIILGTVASFITGNVVESVKGVPK